MSTLADEKYVALTTYKRDGSAKALPVWIVGLDGGKLGFWTSSGSYKALRLKRDPRVVLQPSDARGRVKAGSTPSTGTAALVTSGPDFDAVRAAIKEKYGVMTSVTKFLNSVGSLFKRRKTPYADTCVVITLDG